MTSPRITAQAAVLLVRDVPASILYWQAKLGFTAPSTFGDPPEFAILNRGSARIMLGKIKNGEAIVPFHKQRSGLPNAYFWVDDAKAMFAEVKERGAEIEYDLELQSYDVLEFGVRDPEGQVVSFGQVME
jgi:uncharacterized glyoxalase superfamily protein PhnB